jgi:outer membrane lipoprotein-sorting protein
MLSNPLSRAILLSIFVAPVSLRGQSLDAFTLLESAGRVYRASEGMCAEFKQVLSVPLLGEDIEGEGRLCTRQPGLFSMRFAVPAGDVLLADGTWFWVYRPSSDPAQVLRSALATGPRGVDFYSEFLNTPRDKYRAEYQGKETIAGNAVHRIALTPSHPAPYRSAVLWIESDASLLRKVEITEENGSVRTVTLDAVDVNPHLGADAFRFNPPVGARVITR